MDIRNFEDRKWTFLTLNSRHLENFDFKNSKDQKIKFMNIKIFQLQEYQIRLWEIT